MNERDKTLQAFDRLLNIMDELRERCPWDRKQTIESLRTLTIEETYELSEAIMDLQQEQGVLDGRLSDAPGPQCGREYANIVKELGDLLLHIVFYAKIGSEQGDFTIRDVICTLSDKLVYRHPHVYGTTAVADSEEVVENWEKLKMREKDGNKGVLSGVPSGLPALIKAYRMQDKARAVGFDWEERAQVWTKVEEELAEFKEAHIEGNTENMEAEFGDLLFSLVNAARLYDINPETALEQTNRKFIRRFNYLEQETIKKGRSLKDMTLAEMDEIWERAKGLGIRN